MRDPVCGMPVEEKKAPARLTYQGQKYYFCSRACQRRFEASPREFVGITRGEKALELYEHLKLLTRRLYSPSSSERVGRELPGSEVFALEGLGKRGRCKMRELAQECGTALSTMTGVVDRLVKKGLVRRERIDEDRRVILVELTERGAKVYQERLEADMHLIGELTEALSPAEQEALLGYLRRINGAGPA